MVASEAARFEMTKTTIEMGEESDPFLPPSKQLFEPKSEGSARTLSISFPSWKSWVLHLSVHILLAAVSTALLVTAINFHRDTQLVPRRKSNCFLDKDKI